VRESNEKRIGWIARDYIKEIHPRASRGEETTMRVTRVIPEHGGGMQIPGLIFFARSRARLIIPA